MATAATTCLAADSMTMCARRLAHASANVARMRQRALARCLHDVTSCPTALNPSPSADDEPCLAAAGRRCRARLDVLARLRLRARQAGETCARALGPVAFLGDDGLGYASLAAFCPRLDMRANDTDDALACEATAVECVASATIGALAPRAVELLVRAGVTLDAVQDCFGSPRCGNAELDPGEECDDGPQNSDTEPDACRTTCLDAFCGDGTLDDGESCDDGNSRAGDGCDAECLREEGVCGNLVVEANEECDDGNHRDGDGCDADCFREADVCGNGVVDDGESCDDGNVGDGDGCDAACHPEDGVCGNGVVEGNEECDGGALNSDLLPDRCRTDCRAPSCGDGAIDPGAGETCEPPGTILCGERCEVRVPLAAARSSGRASGLPACQRALLRAGVRVAARTRALVGRCVQTIRRCLLRTDAARTDDARCLARTRRACDVAATRRDELVARATSLVARRCGGARGGAPTSLEPLLHASDGLGFAAEAARCPFGAARPPEVDDLVACVLGRAGCFGERLIAETMPRAYEFLLEVLDDPEARFPCVVDPDDLGDVESPSGAFIDGT